MDFADRDRPRAFLRALLDAALGAADPAKVVPPHLPSPPRGRTVVVGAGKAAAAMAKAVETHWSGALSGLVITRYGHGLPLERIEVVEASHPVPDKAGTDAAQRILDSVQGLGADDLVLFLASGGGSALMVLPAPGIALEDKRAVTRALLKSGATIGEFNCVRKHLSAIKGGRLAAAAAPAPVVTLAISDVPGDDPAVIASGPTVPDPTSFADARAILAKYAIAPPPAILRHLAEAREESPKPGDPRLAGSRFVLIATPQQALLAAAERARDAGVTPLVLGDAIEGEAREVALVHAGIARQAAEGKLITATPHPAWLAAAERARAAGATPLVLGEIAGQAAPEIFVGARALALPAVLLSGGETTVTVRGKGRGGRNAEFVLALAVALRGHPQIHALAADTDGIDGTEDNAGALYGPDTSARAAAAGVDLGAHLADNDGYTAFKALGDLVVTGPTRTNVNDFRAILVKAPRT